MKTKQSMKILWVFLPFIVFSFLLPRNLSADNGYVIVKGPAAPLILKGRQIGIAGKGIGFAVMTPTEAGYVIRLKSWGRQIFPKISSHYVTFSQTRPTKVVASIQELKHIVKVTDEMRAFLKLPTKSIAKKDSAKNFQIGDLKSVSQIESTKISSKRKNEFPEGMELSGKKLIWKKDRVEMMAIPAGDFLFGKSKLKRNLPLYFMDRFEVTNARYKQFLKATNYPIPPYWAGVSSNRFGNDHQPVVGVQFQDAEAYAHWAGKRLPSELEWEKAARGTDGIRYPWGNDSPTAGLTLFRENPTVGKTMEVGQYPRGRSPYGVDDMAGNVAEWVKAWFSPDHVYRVLKGGCWYDRPKYLRTYSREDRMPSDSGIAWGFRCVVDGNVKSLQKEK